MSCWVPANCGGCYHSDGCGLKYLPLVKSSFHTTIFSDRQQTTIKQTFVNSTDRHIECCTYALPIYDGVSVTGFTCEVADRKLVGVVKEKAEAKAEYDAAVQQGKHAGLLQQSVVSDVVDTRLGNVEAGQSVHVTITYIGELKNDLDSDNIRLTIPTHIAPRYGEMQQNFRSFSGVHDQGLNITIDVIMPEGRHIQSLESPSHTVSVFLGRLSVESPDLEPSFCKASAVLSDATSGLAKDFVFLIKAKDTGNPAAILQTHSTLKDHRALMVSLVPKFSLPSIRPEIVFIADRSGSMRGCIPMLQQALQVFLKSIPSGVKFNICSFGSRQSFLWPKSQDYTKTNLTVAINHVNEFAANYGGTETLSALEATIGNRYEDIPLEMILLTDGDIWAQADAFDAINKAVIKSKHQIRLFPLAIGNGVSHSLIEGLARAGDGFAQAVQLNERIDTRVIRMLKAALTPHVNNYSLEIKYHNDDDFELVEAVNDYLKMDLPRDTQEKQLSLAKPAISLFDASADLDEMDTTENNVSLPATKAPRLIQAPHKIPSLYSFSRTTVYVLMSPDAIQRNPVSVVLKGDSEHGPLRLEIPVTTLDTPGEAISQLAARKAVQDLEEHRGWIYHATNSDGKNLLESIPSRAAELVKREAVRLGTTYGIANKWCSFVAIDADSKNLQNLPGEEEEALSADSEDTASMSLNNSSSSHIRLKRKKLKQSGSQSQSRSSGLGQGSRSISNAQMHQNGILSSLEMAHYDQSPRPLQLHQQAAQLQQMAIQHSKQPMMRQILPRPVQMDQMTLQQVMQTGHTAAMPSLPTSPRSMTPHSSSPSSASTSQDGLPRLWPMGKFRKAPGSRAARFQAQPQVPSAAAEKVHALIALQDFDGFWSASEEIVQLLGLTDAQAEMLDGELLLTTAVVVAFLMRKMSDEEEIWELVVEKAHDWLNRQGKDSEETKQLLANAEDILAG